MQSVELVLNFASAFFAFIAALLWLIASSMEAPAFYRSKVLGSGYGMDGKMYVHVDHADLVAFRKAARRPGDWNKYAAASAGVSAALMAAALLIASH